jgi:hypothetical protein
LYRRQSTLGSVVTIGLELRSHAGPAIRRVPGSSVPCCGGCDSAEANDRSVFVLKAAEQASVEQDLDLWCVVDITLRGSGCEGTSLTLRRHRLGVKLLQEAVPGTIVSPTLIKVVNRVSIISSNSGTTRSVYKGT